MCEDLNDKIDDIYAVDLKTCINALKAASANPQIPFAVIYTLRLLIIQFFRDNETAAEVADEELSQLYSDVVDGQLEDTSPPDFRVEDFTRNSNAEPPKRALNVTIIEADEIIGPQRIRCD